MNKYEAALLWLIAGWGFIGLMGSILAQCTEKR
jgi:hypothetical protein